MKRIISDALLPGHHLNSHVSTSETTTHDSYAEVMYRTNERRRSYLFRSLLLCWSAL